MRLASPSCEHRVPTTDLRFRSRRPPPSVVDGRKAFGADLRRAIATARLSRAGPPALPLRRWAGARSTRRPWAQSATPRPTVPVARTRATKAERRTLSHGNGRLPLASGSREDRRPRVAWHDDEKGDGGGHEDAGANERVFVFMMGPRKQGGAGLPASSASGAALGVRSSPSRTRRPCSSRNRP